VEFERDSGKGAAPEQVRDFATPCGWVAVEDARANYGERRMKAVGQVQADILVVIYTVRDTALRIISARRASRKERVNGSPAHDFEASRRRRWWNG
jgi:uncharacterized DUF497 family protein